MTQVKGKTKMEEKQEKNIEEYYITVEKMIFAIGDKFA